jgi:hypothetical protein
MHAASGAKHGTSLQRGTARPTLPPAARPSQEELWGYIRREGAAIGRLLQSAADIDTEMLFSIEALSILGARTRPAGPLLCSRGRPAEAPRAPRRHSWPGWTCTPLAVG